MDEKSQVNTAAQCGLKNDFDSILDTLNTKKYPICFKSAVKQLRIVTMIIILICVKTVFIVNSMFMKKI